MAKAKTNKPFVQNYLLFGVLSVAVVALYLFFTYIPRIISEGREMQGRNGNARSNNRITEKNCVADDCLAVQDLEFPAGTLPQTVTSALTEAIQDEYKALSTYEAVIKSFGMVRPFSMIKGAEEQHIASLRALFDKYGLEVPANSWAKKVSAPSTIKEACQIGVDAEIANAKLYRDTLLPAVDGYEDITRVFTNLMNASEQKHLPAFDRCN